MEGRTRRLSHLTIRKLDRERYIERRSRNRRRRSSSVAVVVVVAMVSGGFDDDRLNCFSKGFSSGFPHPISQFLCPF